MGLSWRMVYVPSDILEIKQSRARTNRKKNHLASLLHRVTKWLVSATIGATVTHILELTSSVSTQEQEWVSVAIQRLPIKATPIK